MLACELVAAVRALRLRARVPASQVLAEAMSRAATLPPQTADRALDADLALATDLLPEFELLAEAARDAGPGPD